MTGRGRPTNQGSWRAASVGYQVNHLGRLMAQALNDRLAPWGVTSGQFAQLLALYERDGVTAAELCRAVGVEQPTMTRTLQRMERDGLIVRERDPADARNSLVRLTEHARSIESDVKAAAQAINERVLASFAPRDRARLLAGLERMIAAASEVVSASDAALPSRPAP